MRYIKELRDGEMVSETYFCKSKQTLQAKNGKSYDSLTLQDKTGTLDGKICYCGGNRGVSAKAG